jgi:cellulose synthase (UDP-forming)
MDMVIGYAAIAVTIVSWCVYVISTFVTIIVNNPDRTFRFTVETGLYLFIVTALCLSALVYLITRQGALHRFVRHQRVPREHLDRHFSQGYAKGLTVLIPSYVEQPKVVEKTIWSAALQEFPDIAIVLLIDDPPVARNDLDGQALKANRAVVPRIVEELSSQAARFASSRQDAAASLNGMRYARTRVVSGCAEAYRDAARWLDRKADSWVVEDHTDVFFREHVLRDLARDLRVTEKALNEVVVGHQQIPSERVMQLFNRLVWIFSVKGWSFERKLYASTPSEGNKAMNLNAFIALMGHRLKREENDRGVYLRDAGSEEIPDFVVRDSEYVLTLDADSMLLRDYCLRLVYFLEQPGNERVAVAQTPYSSYRGAPTRIERIAAATTDIQHMLHQGLTYFDATFWVGANAVIRKRALDDIVQVSTDGDRTVKTYIQDRTVIEDTESSVDLGFRGWHLVNYPERLSYSATPPDFGSLVVQRRRWANGGLLIVRKFLHQVRIRRRASGSVRFGEVLLRVNYMVSIAWSSFGLMFLLAYPFDNRLLSPWVVLAAVPYFAMMAGDLKRNGYKRSDIFRIYGFNIVLLTVNLAGTFKSIEQGLTNTKIPFVRTPKVKDRTASPPLYVLMPWAIIVFSCFVFYADYLSRNWGNAVFAGFNAVVTLWALVSYIGVWNSVRDAVAGIVSWFFVPDKPPTKRKASARRDARRAEDWEDALYFGDRVMIHDSRIRES